MSTGQLIECMYTGIVSKVIDASGYTGDSVHPLASPMNRTAANVESLGAVGLAGFILAECVAKKWLKGGSTEDMVLVNRCLTETVPLNSLRSFAKSILSKGKAGEGAEYMMTLGHVANDLQQGQAALVSNLKRWMYNMGSDELRREVAAGCRADWAEGLVSSATERAESARVQSARAVRRMSADRARKQLRVKLSRLNVEGQERLLDLFPSSYEPFYSDCLVTVRELCEPLIENGSILAGNILGMWEELTLRPLPIVMKDKQGKAIKLPPKVDFNFTTEL